ncbi:MAG: DegT/DnrJ/EryC1/StrS family aminotransferase [Bdellovibrionales bacterium]|nr:DegT/DnrJ/EryC1/StrS family aminotransferase [Bdellovibrionales bacterium]MBT3526927.1 DegT/DnrJ/EryC1/StrS family aminotransferase [Bdellovibrionales bacterium]MBT7669393.1 DegT/DnrJ/EryC1/StrS family aminotransferase [Bdellovibrionales bacterium]
MRVSFHNFSDLHPVGVKDEATKRFVQIMEQNSFIEGAYNQQFEQKFALSQQAKHCMLVANGTDALELCLRAYDVGPGDPVGIPSVSFFATAEAVVNVGAHPVFIDVDPKTCLMDPESLKRALNGPKLKAIIPVHLYGMPAPIKELEVICQPCGTHIIEDAAQAHGTCHQPGRVIGDSNNLVTYSFYPTKNLSAFGDAGAIVTNDTSLVDKIVMLRNHGRTPSGHALIGYNSRCDHLQAAILDLKLDQLPSLTQKRREVARRYCQGLSSLERIRFMPKRFVDLSSWHLFPILLPSSQERDSLRAYLGKCEIDTALFYQKALCDELTLSQYNGEGDAGREFCGTTISLPLHPFLTNDQVDYVIEMVSKWEQQETNG